MAGTPTNAYEVDIYIRSDTTAPTDADKPDGIESLSITPAHTMVPTTYLNGSGYETEAPTTTKVTATISGKQMLDDAPQQLLHTALMGKSVVHITVIRDPAAAAGSKGHRYPFYVAQNEDSKEPTNKNTFNYSLSLAAAPVAV